MKFTAATVGAFTAETPEGLLDIAFAGVTAEGFSRLLLASQTAPGVWGDARVVFAPAGNLYGFSALVTLGQSVIAAADGVGPLWMTPPQEGTGLWSAKALGGLATPIDLALADVTGDGLVDLVASTPESSTSLFHTHTHTHTRIVSTRTLTPTLFLFQTVSVYAGKVVASPPPFPPSPPSPPGPIRYVPSPTPRSSSEKIALISLGSVAGIAVLAVLVLVVVVMRRSSPPPPSASVPLITDRQTAYGATPALATFTPPDQQPVQATAQP